MGQGLDSEMKEREAFERWFTTEKHPLRYDERMAAREGWERALAFKNAEVIRLCDVIEKANAQAEKFERWHYLDLHDYERLFKAAIKISNYAWSSVTTDCAEATDYLNEILSALRKELGRRLDSEDQSRIGSARDIEDCVENDL